MSEQSEKDLEVFFPEGIEVIIAGEKFYIKPFVLRNRIKVVKLISDVFAQLQGRNNIKGQNETVVIGALIEIAGDKLIDVYEMVLGKDREWLEENVRLKDEVNIIKAIVEVNEFPFLLSQINGLFQKKV